MPTTTQQRLSKGEWLKAGLEQLSEAGVDGLKIDLLCNQLQVTKGSFYHHFQHRKAFVKALLDYWVEENTMHILQLTDRFSTPTEKIAQLDNLSTELSPGVEIAIRVWAQHDPLARSYQERVDQVRLEYLQKISRPFVDSDTHAAVIAQLVYAVYIGSRQIMPSLQREELSQLNSEIRRLYSIW